MIAFISNISPKCKELSHYIDSLLLIHPNSSSVKEGPYTSWDGSETVNISAFKAIIRRKWTKTNHFIFHQCKHKKRKGMKPIPHEMDRVQIERFCLESLHEEEEEDEDWSERKWTMKWRWILADEPGHGYPCYYQLFFWSEDNRECGEERRWEDSQGRGHMGMKLRVRVRVRVNLHIGRL